MLHEAERKFGVRRRLAAVIRTLIRLEMFEMVIGRHKHAGQISAELT